MCGRCGVFSKGSVYVEKIGMECIPQFTGVWRSRGVGMECVCLCLIGCYWRLAAVLRPRLCQLTYFMRLQEPEVCLEERAADLQLSEQD